MLPGSLQPYLALAAVLAIMGAFVSGDLYRGRADKIAYDGAIAGLQRDAAQTLAAAESRNRAKEQADADKSRDIDAAHAATVASDAAQLDVFAQRLRDATKARDSCRNAASGQAANPGSSPPTAGSGDDGHRGEAVGIDIRNAVKELQRYAIAAHDFALECGR